MANISRSAGVTAKVTDNTGPTAIQPVGIPAGVIGTSQKGPAFVPTTVATTQDYIVNFGLPTDDACNGPLAVAEWLKNKQSATFLRVLGAGQGLKRESSGDNAGHVKGAGFVVGSEQPQASTDGSLASNVYANVGGVPGRTFFLGTFMSESAGSSYFTDAGLAGSGVPVVRAVLMAASGVLIHLSSSYNAGSNEPGSTDVAGTNSSGAVTGSVILSGARQEFVMLLNGHKGLNEQYPNIVSASFDVDAPNYFKNVFNADPLKMEEAGYVLYADYPIHSNLAVITGSDIVIDGSGSVGDEPVAFVVPGAMTYNSGSSTAPNFENFEDRYRAAKTPWFTSQKFGGSYQNLFRIHSLDDGTWANTKIKVSIQNIVPGTTSNPYGSFDVLVREFYDNDKNQSVLEAFRSVTLDQSSDRFIGRVIGDYHTYFNFDANLNSQKLITNGDYPNKSQYVRVEIDDSVLNDEIDPSSVPFGFRGMPHLVTSGSSPLADFSDDNIFTKDHILYDTIQPPVPFRKNLILGASPNQTVDKGFYWGVQFTRQTSVSEPNSSFVFEKGIESNTKYFPDFQVNWANMVAYDNEGAVDSAEMGIIDADRFCNNGFNLSNLKVTYDSSTTDETVTTQTLTSWEYVRSGNVPTDSGNGTRALKSSDLADTSVRQLAKFTAPMFGGFDGVRIFNKDTAVLSNKAVTEEMAKTNRGTMNGPTVVAYNKAIDIMGDSSDVDIELLVTPGIRHSIITDKAMQTTEERFDALYLMDVEDYDVSNNLVTGSSQIPSVRYTTSNFRDRGINSSFGAAFYPDVDLRDELAGTIRTVPATVAVLGAFAKNDALGHPWFAPAGFTRGALDSTNDAAIALNKANMDDLQSVSINPLVAFPGSGGVVVWGQKTLLASDSSLERINVRRLLIDIRRKVRKVASRVIFEQNRAETLADFEAKVKPILKKIQDQNGLEDYLVRIDSTTTTQADIENKTIRGKIFLVPTKTLEFLSLDFTLTNNGNFSTQG